MFGRLLFQYASFNGSNASSSFSVVHAVRDEVFEVKPIIGPVIDGQFTASVGPRVYPRPGHVTTYVGSGVVLGACCSPTVLTVQRSSWQSFRIPSWGSTCSSYWLAIPRALKDLSTVVFYFEELASLVLSPTLDCSSCS